MFLDLAALPLLAALVVNSYYFDVITEAIRLYKVGRSFVKVIGFLEDAVA